MNDREFTRLNARFEKVTRDGHAIVEALKSLGRANEVTKFVQGYTGVTLQPLLNEIRLGGCAVLGDGSIGIVRVRRD
jgi:hypothetical protein